MLRQVIRIDEKKGNGCGGLQRAAENALKNSGKFIPWQVVTVSIDGKILEQ